MLGWLADQIGRKTNLMLTLVGLLLFNLISASSSSFSVYLLSRFIVGFFIQGNVLSAIVLLSELVGPAYRGTYVITLNGSFSLGIVFLPVWASYFRHSWRMFSLSVTVIGLPFLLLQWFMVESPRWYLAQNRQAEAEALLKDIGEANGETGGKLEISLRQTGAVQARGENVTEIFTNRRLVWVSLILSFSWFVVGLSYYGLTLAAGQMGTDIYTGTALSGLVELPATLFVYWCVEWKGRRFTVVSFLSLSGVLCLAIRLVSTAWSPYFGLFGKLCVNGAFTTVYVISGEIFSTSIRNSAIGIVSAMSRVGSIMSPFIVMLGENYQGLQFFIFGSLCLTAGFFGLWLPETMNKPLPETVKEMLIDKRKKIEYQLV